MRNLFRSVTIAAPVLLVLAGCSQTEEYREVIRAQQKAIEEVTEILAGIDDEKGMVKAQDDLNERIDRFERIARKARALPGPSPETVKQMEPDVQAMQAASEKLISQVDRVRKLPGSEKFFEQFDGMTTKFSRSPD
jgi:DNA repair ATPase RecN